jgi:hypothetical protein
VDCNQALGALAIGAEYALRAAVFRMVTENLDAISDQSARYHFAFIAKQRFAIPLKNHLFFLWYSEDWMFGNSVSNHVASFFS